jgi:ribosomal protein S18 acetylase RimI-like enzyme
VTYRPAGSEDVPLLHRMLWVAFNWRDEAVPADHWPDPTAPSRYVEGFGRPGDAGVVAEMAGRGVGAAWYRRLPAEDAGYGFVAADVPEITLAVAPDARGHGIGSALMRRLLETAVAQRVPRVSLSVEPDNPARHLYETLGFELFGTSGGSLTLVRKLDDT